MKFLHTTNLFKTTFLVALCTVFSFNAEAQIENLNDIYSFYGEGTIYNNYFAPNRSLGHFTTAYRSPLNANPSNPASYTSLNLTSFEVAIDFDGYQINGANSSGNTSDFGISYLNIAFPLNENWGAGFGLNPYSKVNYAVNSYKNTNESIGLERSLHIGRGGLSQMRFGTAYRYKNLSIGANFGYLFGTIEKELLEIYEDLESIPISTVGAFSIGDPDPRPAVQRLSSDLLKGFSWDIGTQFQKQIGKSKNMLTIGAKASLVTNLTSDEDLTWERGVYQETESATQFSPVELEPLVSIDDVSTDITHPGNYSLGFAIADSNEVKWLVGIDLRYADWSNYKKYDVSIPEYQDSYGISIGASVTPDRFKLKSLWSRIEYRFGLYYDSGNLKIADNSIPQYGLTFGMGVPLSFKSFNKLNLSFDAGQKGSTKNGLVSQNYLKMTMGFTFNSKWFQKRRYD